MGQVKKTAVMEAIQAAAFKLFVELGYAGTSMPQIAKAAGISTANVYVYFGSKLEVLYSIYDPWIRSRLDALQAELATIDNPSKRLFTLFKSYWRDIPAEHGGFVNNIIQALSTAEQDDLYQPALAEWMEERLREMVLEALPKNRRHLMRKPAFAHLMLMAFNGFIVYHHINPQRPCDDDTIDLMCVMLLGEDFSRTKARPR